MEDFVNFSIAKKLKEKGFDYPCIGHYVNSQLYIAHYLNAFHSDKDESLDAPAISQVLKWLRREKKIHIEPCILADADTDADGKVINEFTYWSFSIMSIATGDMIYFEYEHIDDKRFNSCEEAALAGIKYVLDNLI